MSVVTAFLPLTLAGCRSHHADPATVARVRVIDAVPGPARLDFWSSRHQSRKGVEYRSDSGYTDLDPGEYMLGVKPEDGSAGGTEVNGAIDAGRSYTILALPPAGHGLPVKLKVIRDRPSEADNRGRATVWFITAAPEFPRVSFTLDSIVAQDGLKFAVESEPISLAPGDYDLKLWTGDDKTPLLGPMPFHVQAGHRYTIAAMGDRRNGSLTVQEYDD